MVFGGPTASPVTLTCCLTMILLVLSVAGNLATPLSRLRRGWTDNWGDRQETVEASADSRGKGESASTGDTCESELDMWWPAVRSSETDLYECCQPVHTVAADCCSQDSSQQRNKRLEDDGKWPQNRFLEEFRRFLAISNATENLQRIKSIGVQFFEGEQQCRLEMRKICKPKYMALLWGREFQSSGNKSGFIGPDMPAGSPADDLKGVTDTLDNLSVRKFWQRQEQQKPNNRTEERNVVGQHSSSDALEKIDLEGKMDHDEVGELVNFVAAGNGGKVIQANPEMTKPIRAIDGRSDSFLKTDCGVDSWLILELSQVARVRIIELTMKEMYSSRVAEFEAFSRDSHPSKVSLQYPEGLHTSNWQHLGRFAAENRKGSHQFRINTGSWVRYLGIHLLLYHGSESVCAINEIKVFGVSAAQDIVAEFMRIDPEDATPSEKEELANNRLENETNTIAGPDPESGTDHEGLDHMMTLNSEAPVAHKADAVVDEKAQPPPPQPQSAQNGQEDGKTNGNGELGQLYVNTVIEEKVESHSDGNEQDTGTPPSSVLPSEPNKEGEVKKHRKGNRGTGANSSDGTAAHAPRQRPLKHAQQAPQASVTNQQPAVRAYEKIRQDIHLLQYNNSMLWTYVDQLQSGLQQTISDMDKDIAMLVNGNVTLWGHFVEVQEGLETMSKVLSSTKHSTAKELAEVSSSVRHLERNVRWVQEEMVSSQKQSKMVMGSLNMLGFCAGALALKSHSIAMPGSSLALLVAALSTMNMVVGILNLIVSISSTADWALQYIKVGMGGAFGGL